MPDSFAVFRVMGYAFDYSTGEVSREDGYDAVVFRHGVSGSFRAVAHFTLVFPGGGRGGGIYGHQESQVRLFVVDGGSDFWFPGHAPELGIGAGFCQTDEILDVGR